MMLSLVSLTANAGEAMSRADVLRRSNTTIGNSIQRAPSQLPSIDVIYDSDNFTIEFRSSIECDAMVFVYDMDGNLIETSDSLDTVLYVSDSASSAFYIRIESDNWYATAEISD